jgi:hypothetical protein
VNLWSALEGVSLVWCTSFRTRGSYGLLFWNAAEFILGDVLSAQRAAEMFILALKTRFWHPRHFGADFLDGFICLVVKINHV